MSKCAKNDLIVTNNVLKTKINYTFAMPVLSTMNSENTATAVFLLIIN